MPHKFSNRVFLVLFLSVCFTQLSFAAEKNGGRTGIGGSNDSATELINSIAKKLWNKYMVADHGQNVLFEAYDKAEQAKTLFIANDDTELEVILEEHIYILEDENKAQGNFVKITKEVFDEFRVKNLNHQIRAREVDTLCERSTSKLYLSTTAIKNKGKEGRLEFLFSALYTFAYFDEIVVPIGVIPSLDWLKDDLALKHEVLTQLEDKNLDK